MISLITLFKCLIGFDIYHFYTLQSLGYTLLSDIWITGSEHMFSFKLLIYAIFMGDDFHGR